MSLNEARVAMQRVVNEQKLILERHRAGTQARALMTVSASAPPPALPSAAHMTPLRQATTRISPILDSGRSSAASTRLSPAEVVTTAVLQAHERKISGLRRQYDELQHSVDMNRLLGSPGPFGDSVMTIGAGRSRPVDSGGGSGGGGGGSGGGGGDGGDAVGPSNALLALQLKSATKTIESLEAKEGKLKEQLTQLRAENSKLRSTVGQQTQQMRESHDKFESLTKVGAQVVPWVHGGRPPGHAAGRCWCWCWCWCW